MTRFFRRFPPILFLLVLLCACANGGQSSGSTSSSTPNISTPTPLPASALTDVCPQPFNKINTCLTPHALRVAYGIEPLYEKGFAGKGQTVIDIVSFGSPTLQQDLARYDATFGLPPINLQIISPLKNVARYDPRGDAPGWASETTLDVEIIHALAPDARVVVLTSPVAETEGTIGLPQFRQLIQYAITNHLGNIFSQSWGASELTLEDKQGQQELQQWNTLFQQATTTEHMTFFSSSGDNGATDYSDIAGKTLATVRTTSFAPDSPWVTAVGGTSLIHDGSSYTETAWTFNGLSEGASGGGFSRFYAEPSYQKTLPASLQGEFQNHRGVPDVAADADPSTGLITYETGVGAGGTMDGWSLAGGTSAAAPTWSAIMAIANQMAGHPLGFINPTLYKLAASSTYSQDFHDITAGNNNYPPTHVQGYSTAKGWDPVTGLGSPDAEKLIPDLIAAMK
jgi:subtilase family serine protease